MEGARQNNPRGDRSRGRAKSENRQAAASSHCSRGKKTRRLLRGQRGLREPSGFLFDGQPAISSKRLRATRGGAVSPRPFSRPKRGARAFSEDMQKRCATLARMGAVYAAVLCPHGHFPGPNGGGAAFSQRHAKTVRDPGPHGRRRFRLRYGRMGRFPPIYAQRPAGPFPPALEQYSSRGFPVLPG